MREIDELAVELAPELPPLGAPADAPPRAERPTVGVEDAMTLQQARAVSGRRGARLVLVMGEPASGKTALTAMLWQQFLEQDGLAGHRLAGSRTTRGFERRAHWARLQSRQQRVQFPPTRAEDGGLLHMRVRRPDGRRVELFLADLAGEQFERVREGQPLLDELPWAGRADRFAVVLDAEALSLPGQSEIAVTRARRLLLALQTSGAVRDSARVALVVTKSDRLGEAGAAALARHEGDLLQIARRCDPEAICVFTAAVALARAERQGLGDWIDWLCRNDRRRAPIPVPEVSPGRSIAAFRA
jgi:hypothetical protein